MKTKSKSRKTWKFLEKNHLIIFISLIALFLLLWILDICFSICPYGTIPLIIGVIFEVIILIRKTRK